VLREVGEVDSVAMRLLDSVRLVRCAICSRVCVIFVSLMVSV